jgi:hypothetical protein
MTTVDELRPYRWIYAVRRRDYDTASVALLENANDLMMESSSSIGQSVLPSSSTTSSTMVSTIKTAVSIASICTTILERQFQQQTKATTTTNYNNSDGNLTTPGSTFPPRSDYTTIMKRRRVIDRKRDLINAQEQLLLGGDGTNDPTTTTMLTSLLSPDELLDLAVSKCRTSSGGTDQQIHYCFIGLIVCDTGFCVDDDVDDPISSSRRLEAVAYIWYEAINADHDRWYEYTSTTSNNNQPTTATDLTISSNNYDRSFCTMLLQTTVFGGLYQQCQEMMMPPGGQVEGVRWDDAPTRVQYGEEVEQILFEKIATTAAAACSASASSSPPRTLLFTSKLLRLLRSVIMMTTTTTTTTTAGTTTTIRQ